MLKYGPCCYKPVEQVVEKRAGLFLRAKKRKENMGRGGMDGEDS